MDKTLIEEMDGPADPHRCQATMAHGQCQHKGVRISTQEPLGPNVFLNFEDQTCYKHGTFCMLHGGNKQVEAAATASLRQYRLTKWQSRLVEFTDSSILKSLREEIGILRILLEERLNFCKDTSDLILTSGPISDLVLKIERVVTSCHKLESRMGQHLDKAAVLQLAARFVRVISEELADQPDKIDNISSMLLDIIKEENNEDFKIITIFLLLLVLPSVALTAEITKTFAWDEPTDLDLITRWELYWSETAGGPYTKVVEIPKVVDQTVFQAPATVDIIGSPGSRQARYFVLIACGTVQEDGQPVFKCSENSNEISEIFNIAALEFKVPVNFRVIAE